MKLSETEERYDALLEALKPTASECREPITEQCAKRTAAQVFISLKAMTEGRHFFSFH